MNLTNEELSKIMYSIGYFRTDSKKDEYYDILNQFSKYAEKYIKEKNIEEIMDEESIHIFLHIANKEKINIDNIINQIEYPNMDYFDELINRQEDIPEKKIKEFIQNVSFIKLKTGKIPEKYCNYLLKNFVLGKISKKEYGYMFKRVLTEITYNYLEQNGVEDTLVYFQDLEKVYFGAYRREKNSIEFNINHFFENNDLKKIDNAFHEATHAIQNTYLEKAKNNPEIILNSKLYAMLKENIIIENNYDYYDDNYKKLEIEFDARLKGAINLNKFLIEIGLTEKKIAILSDKTLKESLKEECSQNYIRDKKIYNYNEMSIDDIVLDILRRKKQYILDYPILNLEFKINDEGIVEKKSKEELKKEYYERLKQLEEINDIEQIKKLNSLYGYLLNGELDYENNSIDISDIIEKIKNNEKLTDEEYMKILLKEEYISDESEVSLFHVQLDQEQEMFNRLFASQKDFTKKLFIYGKAKNKNINIDLSNFNIFEELDNDIQIIEYKDLKYFRILVNDLLESNEEFNNDEVKIDLIKKIVNLKGLDNFEKEMVLEVVISKIKPNSINENLEEILDSIVENEKMNVRSKRNIITNMCFMDNFDMEKNQNGLENIILNSVSKHYDELREDEFFVTFIKSKNEIEQENDSRTNWDYFLKNKYNEYSVDDRIELYNRLERFKIHFGEMPFIY